MRRGHSVDLFMRGVFQNGSSPIERGSALLLVTGFPWRVDGGGPEPFDEGLINRYRSSSRVTTAAAPNSIRTKVPVVKFSLAPINLKNLDLVSVIRISLLDIARRIINILWQSVFTWRYVRYLKGCTLCSNF